MVLIEKDDTGEYKRIWLESAIHSPETILNIQEQFSEVQGFKPYPSETLHVTIFHFGKPQSLYNEIKMVVPSVTETEFLKQTTHLLQTINNFDLNEFALPIKGWNIFNKPENPLEDIVGIELAVSSDIVALRKDIAAQIDIFLKSLGIKNSKLDQFVENSPNLKYSCVSTFRPHISIGTITSDVQLPSLRNINDKVMFKKPEWFNITFKEQ